VVWEYGAAERLPGICFDCDVCRTELDKRGLVIKDIDVLHTRLNVS
jgi:hypothetical protein